MVNMFAFESNFIDGLVKICYNIDITLIVHDPAIFSKPRN